MADLTITAANVAKSSNAKVISNKNGSGTLTAGTACAIDGNSEVAAADCDSGTAVLRTFVGILIGPSADNQPAVYQEDGDINLGATLVPGTVYVLSATAGGICPIADLVTGDYVVLIGYAISTSILRMFPKAIRNTGIQVPA